MQLPYCPSVPLNCLGLAGNSLPSTAISHLQEIRKRSAPYHDFLGILPSLYGHYNGHLKIFLECHLKATPHPLQTSSRWALISPGITNDLQIADISSPGEIAALEGGLYGIKCPPSSVLTHNFTLCKLHPNLQKFPKPGVGNINPEGIIIRVLKTKQNHRLECERSICMDFLLCNLALRLCNKKGLLLCYTNSHYRLIKARYGHNMLILLL